MHHSISYVSRALVRADSTAIEEILAAGRRHNPAAGITGALYYDGRTFFHTIEGPAAQVHALYARIREDRRHCAVRLRLAREVSRREFEGHAMKGVNGLAQRLDPAAFSYPALVAADRLTLQMRIALLAAL